MAERQGVRQEILRAILTDDALTVRVNSHLNICGPPLWLSWG
jgi:hypothetical protein